MVDPKIAITFTIKVKSALHIGQAPLGAGEYLFTQRHIPGSALRGALAEVCIAQGMQPEPGSDFETLFEGPAAVRFEPAYPAKSNRWGYPFPLTARRCKHHGGFPSEDAKTEEAARFHGVFDTLVSQIVFEAYLEAGKLPCIEKALCPHCWEGVTPAAGVYTWRGGVDGRPGPAATPLKRHTHTAINRERSVAEDNMLFTVETIEPETLLQGCMWVPPQYEQTVKAALCRIEHLGRGATRGQGNVAIELTSSVVPGDTQARITALNKCFADEVAYYAALAGDTLPLTERLYFTLDLLSPAVLGISATATLAPPDLGLTTPTTLIRRFVVPETIGGWWNVARLPYATALAAKTGSLFLYAAPANVDLAQLSAELDALRATGIGRYRERGYGAVMACAPFHLWTTEKEAAR